jgi:ssDNA-binding Zn-finger/Zn-ribbon topoisomerase 1
MKASLRLSGTCPLCSRPLVRKTRRSDGNAFLSCTGYPSCKFAEDFDQHVDEVAREIADLRDEVQILRAQLRAQPMPGRRPSTSAIDISRELKLLVASVHPDRHQTPEAQKLAHELAVRVNALRSKIDG